MYVLNAYDIEGVEYNPPIIKVTGLEAVRSSTPQVCRENIKEALKIILNGTEPEFHKFVAKFREKFDTLTFEQVASPRSVNNMTVYADKQDIYKKGTPIQVKGSLIFNSLLDKYNIISIPKISDGDKVKFAYLKVPNPIQSTVISSADTIPSEFGIDDYIDKDMQFSKTFIKPVEEIASIIGWSTEHRATLKGFFS
jgi:DNA polymerase elongation subunit (family B)